MNTNLDIHALCLPISAERPSGEDLRYTETYEVLKEARRADEPLDLGGWQRQIKTAEWERVIEIAGQALAERTKDLQIAAWYTEALLKTEGLAGLARGLKLLADLVDAYWDTLYPLIEDGDLEFRIAPFEFLNDKLAIGLKQIPLTDTAASAGYSWLQWKESRAVGYAADLRNHNGDIDEDKEKRRSELVAEGKPTAEDYDNAVAQSSHAYYVMLCDALAACTREFDGLDATIDRTFGTVAPRLAELRRSLDDLDVLVRRILNDKGGITGPASSDEPSGGSVSAAGTFLSASPPRTEGTHRDDPRAQPSLLRDETLRLMQQGGIKAALPQLLAACHSAPSVREMSGYRLLMAQLCLQSGRPDLARPIAEELFTLVDELHLERWESPIWIAEVIDVLYCCLTHGTPSDEDAGRAKQLYQRLCRMDITKALQHGN